MRAMARAVHISIIVGLYWMNSMDSVRIPDVHITTEGLPTRNYYQPGDIDIAYLFGMTQGVRDQLCNDVTEDWAYPYMEAARYAIQVLYSYELS